MQILCILLESNSETRKKHVDVNPCLQPHQFNKPYKLSTIPVPTDLAPNDLLIRVAVASLCHTDYMVRDGTMGSPLPITGSHEGAGTVVAVGSSVTDFQPGDRVMAGIIYHACGECADCKGTESSTQHCTNAAYCGLKGADGFFAEYARVDARWAAKLPDKVSFETAAPMACAGCTVNRGVILAGLKKGEWLGIVGSRGGLGHLGVQFAKALGLKVVGVDARDEGLELTKKRGADVVIDARQGDEAVVQEVHKVTDGKGVAATVNVSDADTAAAMSCKITRMHGTMVQVAQVRARLLGKGFVGSNPKLYWGSWSDPIDPLRTSTSLAPSSIYILPLTSHSPTTT